MAADGCDEGGGGLAAPAKRGGSRPATLCGVKLNDGCGGCCGCGGCWGWCGGWARCGWWFRAAAATPDADADADEANDSKPPAPVGPRSISFGGGAKSGLDFGGRWKVDVLLASADDDDNDDDEDDVTAGASAEEADAEVDEEEGGPAVPVADPGVVFRCWLW